ncbi:unnamed protein product [Closterium sp. Naga37s-1]|nr:unnamed protein product [Closterium sp. Naga37s-1]
MAEQQAIVEEQYTRPQGLYHHRDVNLEELRRLILDAKLAPCHVGSDELSHDLDECPICFLGYPSLNWMKCCKKGMCTECFLVVKGPATHSIECCPFCVTTGASVEYRGRRTAEEILMDMEVDQKAIEAEIKAKRGKKDACAAALPVTPARSTAEAEAEMHDHTSSSAVDLSNEEEQRAIEEEIRRIQEQEAYAASLVDMDEQRMIEAEIQLRREEEAYYALLAGQVAALDDPDSAAPAAEAPNLSDNPSDNPPGSSAADATLDAAAAAGASSEADDAEDSDEEVIDEDQVEAPSSSAPAVGNGDSVPSGSKDSATSAAPAAATVVA